jgi:ribonuclease BN (tRNA processing enzyme)
MGDIRLVLPTHSHADHVGGIECLALYNHYVGQRFMKHPKLKMIITPEYQRILWDYTLRGGLEWNEEQPDGKRKLSFGDFFDIITPHWETQEPREAWAVELADKRPNWGGAPTLRLELVRTNHIPEQAKDWEASFVSYALVIDGRVLYTADTQFDPELIHYAGGDVLDHIFHDVQFFQGAVHAPLQDLQTMPKSIKEMTTLMHYADDWEEYAIEGEFAGWAQEATTYRFDAE